MKKRGLFEACYYLVFPCSQWHNLAASTKPFSTTTPSSSAQ